MKSSRIPAILIATVLSIGALAPVYGLDYSTMLQFRQVATATEHQGKWMRINWLKDMDQAKARAKAEHKPILVFLVIGFKGQPHADDC
jgi:hypothetical protein